MFFYLQISDIHRMGFLVFKEVIECNDLVILYINFNTIYPVSVKETIISKKGVEVENIYKVLVIKSCRSGW